jgi:uncharacterized protein (TIGR02270 family)
MNAGLQPIIASVVSQHAEEAATLYGRRAVLVRGPAVRLWALERDCDARLLAHLDGLSVAGEKSWPFCDAALETPFAGAVFTAAVRAIEEMDHHRLDRLFALAEASSETVPGLTGAFGWLGRHQLQGVVARMLSSDNPLRRSVGIAACAMHRVSPGTAMRRSFHDPDPNVRMRAYRTVGELGASEFVESCSENASDENAEGRFWGSWSSVLLGNRRRALQAVENAGVTEGLHRARAFQLSLQAISVSKCHEILRMLAGQPDEIRWVIRGSGLAGDPAYVPWLVDQMRKHAVSRLAAEAFSVITGADLSALDLEGSVPENFESGPNDNPEDRNVEMDSDDGLPWPDADKIEKWWAVNASRFQRGTRYFMGAAVTRERCIHVLKTGYQRQRILAAHYLCLLEPGTPLFNTSAPAWRQQRLLAAM